ncbi:MAG TPA: N,N-dimethylformamidase beta subunit family domain-containing protein [Dyadobacter sp.]|nr:N,N-dimethylformamidase beta subunit family domain-containing protein [Dyadobacter sp.]
MGRVCSWSIPGNAVSGIYIARLARTDVAGASHITFIVRGDDSKSDLLFQTSDATWQAYNVYGDNSNGRSLYTGVGARLRK